ncbi:MAG: tRNA preQ1(34) S-adenosylmethionine ribosyltransferase-isomerase QueA [Bacteroidales bacterium]|nr:tRNA preQ1(34) S-adenosylmethionine ribosyltransferase-isomerase QueA [Bacteroidales bacterium]MCM1147057.1 tRNA preQ1(34) S-adenosylmethionine ribosyltransferase-isomerase QueA [Bacteroidales bacterium]MCM1205810.1 tRNA preQ1(34) S-adenosylmethionine ribosyltransferase-isomerase QueA [Bacillota bacterium]MCM1509947.1 tRNA preQ1(34) S-adenosylmethionine ribosyltransferase-isomerase QueA [Clostridium sp.]
MKLSNFKFKLPAEQVALYPHTEEHTLKSGVTFQIKRPDQCRLMVLHKKSQTIDMYRTDADGNPLKDADGNPEYLRFVDIVNYFDEGDTFIFNDTKVFPARLYGTKEKTDAKIEVLLLRELKEEMRLWDVLVEPARKIRIGNKLFFDESGTMVAEVIDNTTSRGRTLRFLYDCPHDEFKRELFALGESPLPRYIIDPAMNGKRERPVTEEDMEDFQCVFAKNEGAVTAPATGLHFTREVMKRLEIAGINAAFITLHCGLGNFNDIEVEDLTKHKMDSEQMTVTEEACELVNSTKRAGHRVCAVGTSVTKATETSVGTDGFLKPYEGWTSKFIFPPYEFGLADSMVANFYHPLSTLIMNVAAFGGYDLVWEAYGKALENGYQFGCFGDAMLILND